MRYGRRRWLQPRRKDRPMFLIDPDMIVGWVVIGGVFAFTLVLIAIVLSPKQ